MRVMCINHDCFDIGDLPYGPDDPQIGEDYNVIESCIGYSDSGIESPCFELEGYGPWVYDQRNFATLPDETADEIEEEQFIYDQFSC